MIRNSILAAALVSASAAALMPVSAQAGEYDGSRMSRSWTQNNDSGSSARGTTNSRRGTPRVTPAPVAVTPPARDNDNYAAAQNDNGDEHEARHRRHPREEGGLDAGEAARIRRAHEESDGHVYLRRGHDDDYGNRSYRSGYSTTYRGNWQPPRPRRHHWWSVWW
jgi:hypothetical protein